jgi:asparagine synthase (glutamine-hydrolysing)
MAPGTSTPKLALRDVEAMAARLVHRGPDDRGAWTDVAAGFAVAHRRLAVIDLSPQGHQPMHSHCGRYVLAYNGEIYNHLAMRRDLGPELPWRGHSDTEVLLAWIVRHGVASALAEANGMFAFALWDRHERCLTLARDRLGEKPLYYGHHRGVFLFGSELKALTAHPAWHGELNRDALAAYMRLGYIPAPHSVYLGIHKLEPGSFLTLRSLQAAPVLSHYWRAIDAVQRGFSAPFVGSEAAADAAIETLLRDAIGKRMLADVPLGAFLSGGIDSTTVVAIMQSLSSRPVRTFSIGFHDPGFDEAAHAGAIAAHLGTEHTELYLDAKQCLDTVAHLPRTWDEPFADPSQIPTLLLCAMARREVTVALSGDGGDELFGGYTRYFRTRRLWAAMGWLPLRLRRALARGIHNTPPMVWDTLLRPFGRLLPGPLTAPGGRERIQQATDILTPESPEALYTRIISHWKDPAAIVTGAREPSTVLTDRAHRPATNGIIEAMMFMDSVLYLPDDILVKLDRASMAVSLEARVPLLDHRLYELAWSLPLRFKVSGGRGKLPLRRIVGRYVPAELLERPKMGFGVPLAEWLRGPLRDWAEALLASDRLAREGWLAPGPIRRVWAEHLAGRRDWSFYLWDVLMFQAWLEAVCMPPKPLPPTSSDCFLL